MKKILFIAALSALVLAGCSSEEEEKVGVKISQEEPFSLYVMPQTTKTELNVAGETTYEVTWKDGDAIAVWHSDGSTLYYDGQFDLEDATTGKFTGTLKSALESGKSYTWYVEYPVPTISGTNPSPSSGYVYVGNVSETAVAAAAGDETSADVYSALSGDTAPMYAVATTDGTDAPEVSLVHLASFVRVAVVNNSSDNNEITVSSIKLTDNSTDRGIAGSYYIDFTGTSPVYTAGTVSGTVSLSVPSVTIPYGETKYFLIPIRPYSTSISNLALEVNGFSKTASTADATLEFSAGHLKTLKYTYDNASTDNSVSIKLVHAEANEIVARWSITGFTDTETDRGDKYQFGIFRDATCTDTVVFYKGASDAGYNFSTASKLTGYRGEDKYDDSPAFVFTGLEPSTIYFVKVVDVTKNITGTAPFSTKANEIVDVTTLTDGSAAAGDVILNEDFGVLTWGGDLVNNAVGISTYHRATYESFSMPSGGVNYTTNSKTVQDYYIANVNTEMGLFNTVNNALDSTRLYNWGWRVVGNYIACVCARPGCVKLGAAINKVGKSGTIFTPALSALKDTATIKVTVTASRYIDVGAGINPDGCNGEVTVFSISDIQDYSSVNSKYPSNYIPAATDPKQSYDFTVDAERGYNDYTLTISGVSPTDVIGVGAPTDSYNRLLIDNIKIEVVSYD